MLQEKNINKLYNGSYTFFLDSKSQREIKSKVKKKYKVFSPFKDAENVIFYISKPRVSLLEITPKNYIKHQDVMGSIFSLGITKEMFGDIVYYNNKYYVYVLDNIKDYLLCNLNKIKNIEVKVNEVNLDYLNNYERKYEEITLIVHSERVDNIISKIIKTNREKVKNKIKNKEIILNCEILSSTSKTLKKDDIFSIKKHGKYKYEGITNKTKNNNYIVKIYKYI